MKKLFLFLSLFLSLTLVLSSCDSKKKHHDDDDDSEESESSSKKSKSKKSKSASEDDEEISYEEAARADSRDAASEPQSRYDSSDKHAFIERWLSVVTKRYLTEYDIEGLPTDDLVLIRNLIFANHNYRFKESRFLYFFNQYPWYEPLYDNVSGSLNKFEVYNVNFLKNHEW